MRPDKRGASLVLNRFELQSLNRVLLEVGRRLSSVEAVGQSPDFKGKRLAKVGDPSQDTDAVNLRTLNSAISGISQATPITSDATQSANSQQPISTVVNLNAQELTEKDEAEDEDFIVTLESNGVDYRIVRAKTFLDLAIHFVSVADISNPTEIAGYSGIEQPFLIAYQAGANVNPITLYAWDTAIGVSPGAPWVVGGWVAVAGAYSYGVIGINSPDDLTITCATDKTVVLAETVWDDMQFSIATGKVPASNFPNWETFTANTSEYAFDVNERIDLYANEPPHGWKEGTVGSVHIHVANKTAQSTGSDRFAKFTTYIAYADANEDWTETSLTGELTIPTGTNALHHFLLVLGNFSMANMKIGSQIKVMLKRIAATSGTEYADSIFVTQVGIHVEMDTIGSRTVSAK